MYVYVCVSLCVCHMCVSIHRVQKRPLSPLELELHLVVIDPTWTLGTEPWSSGGAAGALNCSLSRPLHHPFHPSKPMGPTSYLESR